MQAIQKNCLQCGFHCRLAYFLVLIKNFQLKEHYIVSDLRSKFNFFYISFLISKGAKSGLLETWLNRFFSFRLDYFLVIVTEFGKN